MSVLFKINLDFSIFPFGLGFPANETFREKMQKVFDRISKMRNAKSAAF